MIIPDLEDQFAVFLNDAYMGLYGRLGKALDMELIVKPGENRLYLLATSWGRYCFGAKLGDKKGLIAPIFDNGEVQSFSEGWHFLEAAGPLDFKIFSSPTFSGRGWEIGGLEKNPGAQRLCLRPQEVQGPGMGQARAPEPARRRRQYPGGPQRRPGRPASRASWAASTQEFEA